jgi:hypothetical protein
MVVERLVLDRDHRVTKDARDLLEVDDRAVDARVELGDLTIVAIEQERRLQRRRRVR